MTIGIVLSPMRTRVAVVQQYPGSDRCSAAIYKVDDDGTAFETPDLTLTVPADNWQAETRKALGYDA